jgi:hypothetical protein
MMKRNGNAMRMPIGGMAGWLMKRLRSGVHARPRMELVERITLAPRQTLALIEAEGRRFLVATSPEGAPAFYALDEHAQPALRKAIRPSGPAQAAVRVSW